MFLLNREGVACECGFESWPISGFPFGFGEVPSPLGASVSTLV